MPIVSYCKANPTNLRDLRTLVLDPEFVFTGTLVTANLRDLRSRIFHTERRSTRSSPPQRPSPH